MNRGTTLVTPRNGRDHLTFNAGIRRLRRSSKAQFPDSFVSCFHQPQPLYRQGGPVLHFFITNNYRYSKKIIMNLPNICKSSVIEEQQQCHYDCKQGSLKQKNSNNAFVDFL